MTDKADYSEIAGVYDEVRREDLPHVAWWVAKLASAGELVPGKRLLELGCGTGRWTLPLARRTGCRAVGLDRSSDMLDRARAKDTDHLVAWIEGDCENLDLEPDSFDCALMSLMMHHLEDHLRTFRGVFRLLRPGGIFLIRQGTLENILKDAIHRFFPEALTVDRIRTPFRSEIEWWLSQAGFDSIQIEIYNQHTYQSNMRLLEEIEKRVCSVLHMLDNDAYKSGLERLKEYLRRHADDPSFRDTIFTLFVARKPQ